METLKNRRGGLRAACTRARNKLDVEMSSAAINKVKVQGYVTSMTDKLNELKAIQEDIFAQITEQADFEAEYLSVDDYTESTLEVLSNANLILEVIIPPQDHERSVSESSGGILRNQLIKLPQISLPEFDGTLTGWVPFYDAFNAAVHSRDDITDVQKFTYLKSQLRGDALMLIKAFPLTEASYLKALSILKEIYANEFASALEQMKLFVDLKVDQYSLKGLRSFIAKFKCTIAGMTNLGYDIKDNKSAEFMVTSQMMLKMPRVLADNLVRSAGKELLTLKGFNTALNHELDILYSSCDPSSQPKSNEPSNHKFSTESNNNNNHNNNSSFVKQQTTSNFATQAHGTNKQVCVFCQSEAHKSSWCDKYPTLSERKTQCKVINKCWQCLGRIHFPNPCDSHIICYECKGNHVVALCPTRYDKGGTYNNNNNNDSTSNGQRVSTNAIFNSKLSSSSMALPNLTIPIYSPGRAKRRHVNTLLDSCSQRTMVLDKVADRLKLKEVSREKISLCTVTGVSSEETYKIVNVPIYRFNKLRNITAICVPYLPKQIITPGTKTAVNKLCHQVKLASINTNSCGPTNIELLVGIDHFYDIVEYNKPTLRKGDLYLLPTCYGYTITGRVNDLTNKSTNSSVSTNVISVVNLSCVRKKQDPVNKEYLDNKKVQPNKYNLSSKKLRSVPKICCINKKNVNKIGLKKQISSKGKVLPDNSDALLSNNNDLYMDNSYLVKTNFVLQKSNSHLQSENVYLKDINNCLEWDNYYIRRDLSELRTVVQNWQRR